MKNDPRVVDAIINTSDAIRRAANSVLSEAPGVTGLDTLAEVYSFSLAECFAEAIVGFPEIDVESMFEIIRDMVFEKRKVQEGYHDDGRIN